MAWNVPGNGVLFDLDGVLIDSPLAHAQTWVEVFRSVGCEIDPQFVLQEEGRKAVEIGWNITRAYDVPMTQELLDQLIALKRELYKPLAPHGLMNGVREVIVSLRERDYRVGMVSGSVMENVRNALAEDEISLFDAMILSGDYQCAKPDPEPYSTACRALNCPPESCIAVENAPLGITSAKRAGLTVVALTSTLPREKLNEADFIIQHHNELREVIDALSNRI